jgi:hypothetical protein
MFWNKNNITASVYMSLITTLYNKSEDFTPLSGTLNHSIPKATPSLSDSQATKLQIWAIYWNFKATY